MIHTDKIKKSSGHTDKVIHSWGRKLLIKKKPMSFGVKTHWIIGQKSQNSARYAGAF